MHVSVETEFERRNLGIEVRTLNILLGVRINHNQLSKYISYNVFLILIYSLEAYFKTR